MHTNRQIVLKYLNKPSNLTSKKSSLMKDLRKNLSLKSLTPSIYRFIRKVKSMMRGNLIAIWANLYKIRKLVPRNGLRKVQMNKNKTLTLQQRKKRYFPNIVQIYTILKIHQQ